MKNHREGIYEMKCEDKFLRILFVTLYSIIPIWNEPVKANQTQYNNEWKPNRFYGW